MILQVCSQSLFQLENDQASIKIIIKSQGTNKYHEYQPLVTNEIYIFLKETHTNDKLVSQ